MGKMHKVLSTRIRLELYNELVSLAKEEGIENVSTYVRSILIKQLRSKGRKLKKIEQTDDRIKDFEKQYGEVHFVKLCVSVLNLNKLMVKKGIATKEELQQKLLKEIDVYL